MSNDIAITSQPGATVGTAAAIFSPEGINQLVRFAELMAQSRVTVPAHLAGKPADCMAVAMQAAQWGMNPFAVAQKTHVINGALGYEAQLVNAAITAMAPTKDRVHFEWFGPWENVIGKFIEKTNDKGKKYLAAGWSATDEKGCGVKVWATLKGESEPRVLDLLLTQAQVRNSTLWGSDPKQQLAYLGVKRWARLYCPDVILGVYTPDELQEAAPRVERDITPTPATASGMNKLINTKPEHNQEERQTRSQDEILASFTDAAGKAETVEKLDLIFNGGTWPDGKKRPGACDAMSDKWLEMATDVYNIRREELNEITM
ncbi:TPA: recombinase RecT [Klebsiella pneumoniae]|nr:recombinase RecT [Klebsiella pneumoniae]